MPRFDSRQCKILLFSTAWRPALGPTQPPIQWVPGSPSLGVKRQWREADHTPPSSAKVKNGGGTWLHGIVLNKLSTETTLFLSFMQVYYKDRWLLCNLIWNMIFGNKLWSDKVNGFVIMISYNFKLFSISAMNVCMGRCVYGACYINVSVLGKGPIRMAARSKSWTVFARSNAGIVGSNPTQGMDVWVCVYSVFR
jgi:hypothetical protein